MPPCGAAFVCEIFTTPAGNYACAKGLRFDISQPCTTMAPAAARMEWPRSCCCSDQAITMLRLSVLALVLAVGIGPHASMLCGAWCGGDNLPHACDQQLAWSAAAADDCCESGTINLSAARSTESRQDTVSPSHEAVAARHLVALSAPSLRLSRRHEPLGSNEGCLVTVLRI
jgi:hypothetical protein